MQSNQVTEEVEALLVEVQGAASKLAVLLPVAVYIRGGQVGGARPMHEHHDAFLQEEEHAVAVPTCSGVRRAFAFAVSIQHLRFKEKVAKIHVDTWELKGTDEKGLKSIVEDTME